MLVESIFIIADNKKPLASGSRGFYSRDKGKSYESVEVSIYKEDTKNHSLLKI